MEILRLNKKVINLIKEFHDNNTIISATCSAVMLLISSNIIMGKCKWLLCLGG